VEALKRALYRHRKEWAVVRKAGFWSLFLTLTAAFCYLCFCRLGDGAVSIWDEARHGINGYEMYKTNDWLVTTFRFQPDTWNAKPPLSAWLIALSFRLFGVSAFSMRLYSAVSVALCALTVSLYVSKRFGKLESLITLLFFLSSQTVFETGFTRYADANSLFVLFFTLSMLCMLESERDLRAYYGSAFFFMLAFMTKSFHALLIPFVCLCFALYRRQFRRFKPVHCILCALLGLAPIALWGAARYLRDGSAFFVTMIQNDLLRGVKAVEGHGQPLGYYLHYVFNERLPLLGCFGMACLAAVKKPKLTPAQAGVTLWAAVPLVAYSVSVSKLPFYFFPIAVPMILAGGVFFARLLRNAKLKPVAVVIALAMLYFCRDGFNVNLAAVRDPTPYDSFQTAVTETLSDGNRAYADKDLYVQYAEGYASWDQDDILVAYLAGNDRTLNGGVTAFLADEHAVLFISGDQWHENLDRLTGCAYSDAGDYYVVTK
jgi:4-amino-4-deoxy-L-arabinose transferase-like glycosyltransferase